MAFFDQKSRKSRHIRLYENLKIHFFKLNLFFSKIIYIFAVSLYNKFFNHLKINLL